MKFFVKMPDSVQAALRARGVLQDSLLYCVKADLDAQGQYLDVYLAFDRESLHCISGLERPPAKKSRGGVSFTVQDYSYYPLDTIQSLDVVRQVYAAQLVLAFTDGGEKAICRFSLGFAAQFEKFKDCLLKTKNGEAIDETRFGDEKDAFCAKCGRQFPDQERKVCPHCLDKSSILKRLLKMYGAYKGRASVIMLVILFSELLAIAIPFLSSKVFYDNVLREGQPLYGQVLYVVALIALTGLLSALSMMLYGILLSKLNMQAMHDLRVSAFSSMQRLSLGFFISKRTGSLMTRIDNDVDSICWFFADVVPQTLAKSVTLLGTFSIMFSIHAGLTLAVLAVSAAFMGVLYVFSNKFQVKYFRRIHVATRKRNNTLVDTLNGQRVVKAFAREEREKERFGSVNGDMRRADMESNIFFAKTDPTIYNSYQIAGAVIYCIGAWLAVTGSFTLGGLTAIYAYINRLLDPMDFFMQNSKNWSKCADAASRIFELLDASPTVRESPRPVSMPQVRGDISLSHVTFEYEPGRPVLHDVSFDVEGGKMFGIVGKTGAGKSTIISLMCRLYDPMNGSISIDGVDLRDIAAADLRRHIGVVSQESYIFTGSIADNIRYARPQATMDEVVEAARAAAAHEFIMAQPDGYDTVVGVGGVSLSGGERQRVSIARAIIQRPSILILDEATAAMDTQTERKIQLAIDSLKKGRTIISIAHRLSTLRDADMLAVIKNGRLEEIGTHDELIRRKGEYFDLYRLQNEALKFIGAGDEA